MKQEILKIVTEKAEGKHIALNMSVKGVRAIELSEAASSSSMVSVTMESGVNIQAFENDPEYEDLIHLRAGDRLTFIFDGIRTVVKSADETPSGRAYEVRTYVNPTVLAGEPGEEPVGLDFLASRTPVKVQKRRDYGTTSLQRQTSSEEESSEENTTEAKSVFGGNEPEA